MKITNLIAVAVTVMFCVACETTPRSTTTVDRVLIAPTLKNAPYKNILVVGATPNRETDRMVEEGLTQRLRTRDIQAHSFVRQSSAKRPSEQAVFDLVRDTSADGVIVVTARFVGAEIRKRDEQVDIDAESRAGNLQNYFRYNYKDVTRPSYADATLNVRLVSDFYDAATQQRVYSVESSTAHGQTNYEIILAESRAIVARLRKDGLIQ